MIGKKLGKYKAADAQRQALYWLKQHNAEKFREENQGEAAKDTGGETAGDVPIPRDKPQKPENPS